MRLPPSQTRAITGLPRFSPARFTIALRPVLSTLAVATALCAPVPQAWANTAGTDSLPDIQRLIKQGQYPQALERIDAYIATRPKDAQGRFTKGLILTEMNRPADAIVIFQRLTEDYPELPEPYNNLAVLYAQQKQYDKARSALEMAIRTHPAYAIAHENLGDVYAKLASQAYDKALQLDSSNAGAQSKLSMIRELISLPGRTGNRPPAPASTFAAPAAPNVSATTGAAPTVVARSAEAARPAATPTPVAPPPKVVEKPVEKAQAADKPEKAEKVAETKPSREEKNEKKAEEARPSADEAAVTKAVHGWAAAWSRKDVKAYLAAYAPDFQVPGGQKRKSWESERASRIDKPGAIQVSVDDLRISFQGDKATVRFRQNYKSASLKSSAGKTLVLIKSGSRWLIQQEHVGS